MSEHEVSMFINKAVDQTPTLVFHLYGRCFDNLANEKIVPDIFVTTNKEIALGQYVEVVRKRKMFVEAVSYFRPTTRKFRNLILMICLPVLILEQRTELTTWHDIQTNI